MKQSFFAALAAGILSISSIGCMADVNEEEVAPAGDLAIAQDDVIDNPFGCGRRNPKASASKFAMFAAQAANDMVQRGVTRISRRAIRNYWQNNVDVFNLMDIWKPNWILDIGGEGVYYYNNWSWGDCKAMNLNMNPVNTITNQPIPALVSVGNFTRYPFATGFADVILLQNAPLTWENVSEITRLLTLSGAVDMIIDTNMFAAQIDQLGRNLKNYPKELWNFGGGMKRLRIESRRTPDL